MYCTIQLRHDRLHGIQSLGVVASACIHKLSYPHKPAFDSFYLLLGMFKKTLDLCELTVDSIIYIGDGNLARLVYAFECTSLRFDRKGRRFFTCQTEGVSAPSALLGASSQTPLLKQFPKANMARLCIQMHQCCKNWTFRHEAMRKTQEELTRIC